VAASTQQNLEAAKTLTGLTKAMVPPAFAPKDAGPRRTFQATSPATGTPAGPKVEASTPQEVSGAAMAAWAAYHGMMEIDASERAAMLEAIADAVHGLGDDLVKLAANETGFSAVRIVAERERLMLVLRMFAAAVRDRAFDHSSIDTAEPSRRPLPKPDLRRFRRGIGPVAIFGPANQPLTGGALGADAVSALAAGCPIVCKSHPEHPLTDAMIARVAMMACSAKGAPPGLITLVHADAEGEAALLETLVEHPCMRGLSFVGSKQAADEIAGAVSCRSPGMVFSASIGTINPVFVLPGALETNGPTIAERLFQSCVNVAGQTCTRPSVVVLQRGAEAEVFAKQLASMFDQMPAAKMRGPRIRSRFMQDVAALLDTKGVRLEGGAFHAADQEAGKAAIVNGCLLRCAGDVFVRESIVRQEVFGPAMVLVMADDAAGVLAAASAVGGALTGSIWMGTTDGNVGRRLAGTLEHRVGRLVFNATPTGLELCPSLVHGGPYPASQGVPATSVGTDAAGRWLRDVSYQNAPEAVLPKELRSANPLGVARLEDGVLVDGSQDDEPVGDELSEPHEPTKAA
jgi:alpha-ketoglutaric semialdehyde dehydrogenase